MGQLVINGGKRLFGEIEVSGSKNAALPLLFSCIILRGVSKIKNLPDISDVKIALEILKEFGAKIERSESVTYIDTKTLEYTVPKEESVSKIRASTYLLGATLARFKKAEVQRFGGCSFANRPIDMHLKAASSFGAEIEGNKIKCETLKGCELHFDKISVGATVNAILMASGALGKSRIYGYAKEPHVIALLDFLKSAGARISICEEYIEIENSELYSGECAVIPDMIEAGTYVALALMGNPDIKIKGVPVSQLSSFFEAIERAGGVVNKNADMLTVKENIKGPVNIETGPYPAFPTDLQPILAPLVAYSRGGSLKESVWESRFGYLTELSKFGVLYTLEGNTAHIRESSFTAADAVAKDLRGGASLLLAALVSRGVSVIYNASVIKRGYEKLIPKLKGVGAVLKEYEKI